MPIICGGCLQAYRWLHHGGYLQVIHYVNLVGFNQLNMVKMIVLEWVTAEVIATCHPKDLATGRPAILSSQRGHSRSEDILQKC